MSKEIKQRYNKTTKKTTPVTIESNVREMRMTHEKFERVSCENEAGTYPVVMKPLKLNEQSFYEMNNSVQELSFDEKYKLMTPGEIHYEIFKNLYNLLLLYANINGQYTYNLDYYNSCKKKKEQEGVKVTTIGKEFEDNDMLQHVTSNGTIVERVDDDELLIHKNTNLINSNNKSNEDNECENENNEIIENDQQTSQQQQTNQQQQPKYEKFKEISMNEMKAFFGINMVMASWDDNSLSLKGLFNGKYGKDYYASVFTYSRFIEIRKLIIFHDIREDEDFITSIGELKQFMIEKGLDVNIALFNKELKPQNQHTQQQTQQQTQQHSAGNQDFKNLNIMEEEQQHIVVHESQNPSLVQDSELQFNSGQSSQIFDNSVHGSQVSVGTSQLSQMNDSSIMASFVSGSAVSGTQTSRSEDNNDKMSEDNDSDKAHPTEDPNFEHYQFLKNLTIVIEEQIKKKKDDLKLFFAKYMANENADIVSIINEKVINELYNLNTFDILQRESNRISEYIADNGIKDLNGIVNVSLPISVISRIEEIINKDIKNKKGTAEKRSRYIYIKRRYVELYRKLMEFKDNIDFLLDNYNNAVKMYHDQFVNHDKDIEFLKKEER